MTRSTHYNRRLVGWLSLAQLISWGSIFYTFALIMEPVERELGLSRVQASLAFSIALLAEGLLAYPVGRCIDRGNERHVMTAGSLLAAVCLAALGAVQSQWGFYLAWAGLGAAMSAVLYSPVFAVVTRRFPTDFRRAIITMTFLGGLASTVFIPLTAWLISAYGWRLAMQSLAVLHLLVCAPLHLLVLRGAPAKRSAMVGQLHAEQGLSQLVRSAPFLLVGGFLILMTSVTSALPAHMISLLRENGLSEAWVIAIPASIGAFQVLGRLLLYFFESRFDLHLANRLIPGLIPLGLAALLVAPWLGVDQTGVVVLFVVLFGIGNGMLTIVKGTAMAQYVSREHVATLNGVLGMPLSLARAAAPLFMGWMWTREVGYGPGLWVLLITACVGVVALYRAQQHPVPQEGS